GADDLHLAGVHRLAQLGQRRGVLGGHPLIADPVEVEVPPGSGFRVEPQHVADGGAEHLVPPQPLHVHPVEVVAVGVPDLSLHLPAPAVNPAMMRRWPKTTSRMTGTIMNMERVLSRSHGREAVPAVTCVS